MTLLKKEQVQSKDLGVTFHTLIARALSKLPDNERMRLRHKFDIAYFVATEKISKKYSQI